MFHMDMRTNRTLKKEIWDNFEDIFYLPYEQAVVKIRASHNHLKRLNENYTGMGEETDKGNTSQPTTTIICFKCWEKGHVSKACVREIFGCSIPQCQSQRHNLKRHEVMVELGKTVMPDFRPKKSANRGAPKNSSEFIKEAVIKNKRKKRKKK